LHLVGHHLQLYMNGNFTETVALLASGQPFKGGIALTFQY